MIIALQIIAGLVLLVLGGEILVRGAASLATAFKISPLVIGLTVVAFGTSAPELGVSLQAALSDNAGVAIGNVIGSNIINVLFVLGASAVIAALVVNSDLIRKDVPIMIAASLAFWWFASDGTIARWEGALMFMALIVYLTYSIRASRKATKQDAAEIEDFVEKIMTPRDYVVNVGLLVGGLVLLGLGANWLVGGATTIATKMGVSNLVIGLTVVAIGTSLPEVVTSIVAVKRGQRDIAVGNVVGSNLFNILCVIGLTGAVAPDGIPVSQQAIGFDLPVMVAVSAICLPILWTRFAVERWEGVLFLLFYVTYTGVLIKSAGDDEFAAHLGDFVIWVVWPAMIITFLASLAMNRRASGRSDS